MNILFLGPHPFYADRGTPIAVKMIVESLVKLGHEVDLLTYHEGREIEMVGVRQMRIAGPPGVKNVPVGPSWKKIVCDVWFAARFVGLVRRNRYDLIHAVEESAMLAWVLQWFHSIPYVMDMDSSIPSQIVERFRWAGPIVAPVRWLERRTVRGATGTLAVCDALADVAREAGPRGPVAVVQDIAFDEEPPEGDEVPNHREVFQIPAGVPVALYVGNLEPYQGIDLLLEALARTKEKGALVVVGGKADHIEAYKEKAVALGIGDCAHWLGPRPLPELTAHLRQADILVSPRSKGVNTPMKVYSYMASGVPVVATDIQSHSQCMNQDVSVLAQPTPEAYAAGLDRLFGDAELRRRLGQAAKELADREYSQEAFDRKIATFYTEIEKIVMNGEAK